jgi:hypothetical protein
LGRILPFDPVYASLLLGSRDFDASWHFHDRRDHRMNPIAVYETRHPFSRRRFELYEHSIRALGSKNSVDFDVTLPLERIDSGFERLWQHSVLFYTGFWLTLIAVFLFMAIVTIVEMQDFRGSFSRPFGLVGSLGTVGLALALWNGRKFEYVQFRTEAGVPVLGIPNDRKRSGEFNQFVGVLVERIHKVLGEAISPPEIVSGEF